MWFWAKNNGLPSQAAMAKDGWLKHSLESVCIYPALYCGRRQGGDASDNCKCPKLYIGVAHGTTPGQRWTISKINSHYSECRFTKLSLPVNPNKGTSLSEQKFFGGKYTHPAVGLPLWLHILWHFRHLGVCWHHFPFSVVPPVSILLQGWPQALTGEAN